LRLPEPRRQQAAKQGSDIRPVSPRHVPRVTQIAQANIFHYQIAEIRDGCAFGAYALARGHLSYALLK
jgi:hypothetical protein